MMKHILFTSFSLLVFATRNLAELDDDSAPTGEPEVMMIAPYFIPGVSRDVFAAFGKSAYLHCRVAHIGEEAQVSWIRKRDLHVISAGVVIFASDARFQVIHPTKSDNWTLHIKYVQERDSGDYECQVNTVPKMSQSFHLTVVEPRTTIQGPSYVKTGSTISITCNVNQPDIEGYVYWYHDSRILQFDDLVTVHVERHRRGVTSQLTIRNASPEDSGNYTCWPTAAHPTSMLVNVVLEGEQPAAMQTGAAQSTCIPEHLLWKVLLSFFLSLLLGHIEVFRLGRIVT